MATNEFSASHIDDNNLLNDESHNLINTPLYTESTITRQQAINGMADIILSSNMEPQFVLYMLKLLKSILPSDNTLPTTIDELFRAMMSSENDWRLAQYLLRHEQYRSLLSSTTNMYNQDSDSSIHLVDSMSMQQEDETDLSPPLSSIFQPFNYHETPSPSIDETNTLCSCEQRLQEHLGPIIRLSRDLDLDSPLESQLNNSHNSIPSLTPWPHVISSVVNPSTVSGERQRSSSETSSTTSNNRQYLINLLKQFEDGDDETSDGFMLNNNKKPCCFEVNGYNLLGGNIRSRYF